jgi:hypothetical protein
VRTAVQSRVVSPSHQAVLLPADNALVDTNWERGVATVVALRALPARTVGIDDFGIAED